MAVDTGNKGSTRKVLRKVEDLGYHPQDLNTIVLTHGHFDHFGSAAGLQARTGAAIAAHKADLPSYEKGGVGILPDPYDKRMETSRLFRHDLFGAYPVKIDRFLEDGEQIGEWQVIHTPGHTPGTISLYSPICKVLITGGWAIDKRLPLPGMLSAKNPFIDKISTNPSELRRSRKRLAELDFQILLCSHLSPRLFPFFTRQIKELTT
jgi:glyoxylase-like metal-dependent hydrolase (beta-lactamase superfamily II)